MATLLIAEKSKAAQAIAEALGPTSKDKLSKYVYVYYVKNHDLYVVPLRGHIKGYKNTKPYQKWTAKDPREIITNPKAIFKMSSKYAGPYISALKKYAKRCNLCIIGTDADVEGCNIGLIDALPYVQKVNPRIEVKQMWLGDLQKTTIRREFKKLIAPKWSWAFCGEARAKIDAIIGFSATREVSLTLQPVLKQINVKFTSIGRVQTSLLYLLYKRENLIRNFDPEPFWKLEALLSIQKTDLKSNHLDNNFTDQKVVDRIYQKIKNEKIAMVYDVLVKDKIRYRPYPLNTSSALQLVTKNAKVHAKTAMKILEELYLDKIISYPRTDSNKYSKDYDHLNVLKELSKNVSFSNYAKNLISQGKTHPNQGKKDAGDHSPITPLKGLNFNSPKLKGLRKRVYELICRYYLSLFGENATERDSKIFVKILDEPFYVRFKGLRKAGFLEIAPFLKGRYNEPTSLRSKNLEILLGQNIPVKKIDIKEKETQPPPRYSDTSLLKLMERENLGTKSTRPSIIQILIDRSYVQRKGSAFFVTELGYLLIESLVGIWKKFLDPKFTKLVESQLEAIKQQKKQMKAVVQDINSLFLHLFDEFRKNKQLILNKMDQLRKSGNSIHSSSGNKGKTQPKQNLTTCACPKCKSSPMKLLKSKKKKSNFFACVNRNCNTYLSLPKKGSFKILKSLCHKCKFNVVKVSTYKNGKRFSYYICPQCWNEGLKKNIDGMGFCSQCENFSVIRGRCVPNKKN